MHSTQSVNKALLVWISSASAHGVCPPPVLGAGPGKSPHLLVFLQKSVQSTALLTCCLLSVASEKVVSSDVSIAKSHDNDPSSSSSVLNPLTIPLKG